MKSFGKSVSGRAQGSKITAIGEQSFKRQTMSGELNPMKEGEVYEVRYAGVRQSMIRISSSR